MSISSIHSESCLAISVAMKKEAEPIISKWNMQPCLDPVALGFHFSFKECVFQTQIKGIRVYVILNGEDPIHKVDRVGTQAAASTAVEIIKALAPKILMSVGTAGGLKEAQLLDVYLSDSKFVYCDRIISSEDYKKYGEGHYNYFSIPDAAQAVGLKLGKIASSNSFDQANLPLSDLERLGVDVVDMESTASAEVAQRYGVEMVAIKVITNFLNDTAHKDFDNNFTPAVSKMAKKVHVFVSWIIKAHSELFWNSVPGLSKRYSF
jgi:nucleoside phosphorylase